VGAVVRVVILGRVGGEEATQTQLLALVAAAVAVDRAAQPIPQVLVAV
jgi:hypothetical protein